MSVNILLFGISCVGKSTMGEVLARRLGYRYYDLDIEIKNTYHMTMQQFADTFFPYEGDLNRSAVLENTVAKNLDKVVAVSPIYYARRVNRILARPDVIGIELQDSPENIYERVFFTDDNDEIIDDDGEYKKLYKKEIIRQIKKDVTYFKSGFKKVERKFNVNNDPPEVAVTRMIEEYGLDRLG